MTFRFRDAFAAAVLIAAGTTHASAQPQTIPLEPYLRAQAAVHATVNGHQGTFMFDTGEGVTVISPAYAQSVGCTPWGRITFECPANVSIRRGAIILRSQRTAAP